MPPFPAEAPGARHGSLPGQMSWVPRRDSDPARPPDSYDRRRTSFAGFVTKTKPAIDIVLNDNQHGAFVPSYTTLDKIEGVASITAPTDVIFTEILITFQGTTRTYVEKVASTAPTTSRSQAFHNFLRLYQPLQRSLLPEDKILKAGKTYKFPFTFVVPESLLPHSCTHGKENDQVLPAHLVLPPSLGDPMLAVGNTLINDLAPDMTLISYFLRVSVTRTSTCPAQKTVPLATAQKKIRIIPFVAEAPPLPPSPSNSLTKSKKLKKGLFKGPLGTLTISAEQPKPLRLPPLHSSPETQEPITTIAHLDLRFDPATPTAQPPRLSSLFNKLKIATFFATIPFRGFPGPTGTGYTYDTNRGLFVETINLSARNVESVTWNKHTRHDSAVSISPTRTSSSSSSSPKSPPPPPDVSQTSIYTATILAPLTLPTSSTKTFVPTFHSCLVSRVYSLDFVLAVSGPGVQTAHVGLKVPVQIATQGNQNARPVVSDEEAEAMREREDVARLIGASRRGSDPVDEGGGEVGPPGYWGTG